MNKKLPIHQPHNYAACKLMENHQFVLDKLAAGDSDYAAGRVVSMYDVERRSQAVLDLVAGAN